MTIVVPEAPETYGSNPTRFKVPGGFVAELGIEVRLPNPVVAVGVVRRPDSYYSIRFEPGLVTISVDALTTDGTSVRALRLNRGRA